MKIIKASYGSMGWVDALKASRETRSIEERVAAVPEDQAIDNALERTVEAVFDLPTKEKSPKDAVRDAAREISEGARQDVGMEATSEIRGKLAARGIDPVELGVAVNNEKLTKEQWDGMSDPRVATKVAVLAAQAYEKKVSQAWQDRAMQPARRPSADDLREGMVMSSPIQGEDSHGPRQMIPANANSIMDPRRLDRFAEGPTEHDKSVKAIRDARAARQKQDKQEASKEQSPIAVNDGARVMRSGSAGESSEFMHRVPRNQVSIMDVQGFDKLSPEEKRSALEKVFASKLADNGSQMREDNKKHKQSIQRDSAKEKDRSWEKVAKPASTGDITKRLVDLWMPKGK